jgi:hypothetical protein
MFTPFAFVKQAATGGGGAFPLTTAFLAATGITGSANIQALQDFETGLTTYSLLSKFTAIYPLMGGNATMTSYNFIDPTQYQITWSGTLNYYIDGVQTANGGGGLGDTGIPGSALSVSEGHQCAWINTNEAPEALGTGPYASDWGCGGDPFNPDLSQYYFSVAQGAAENALIQAWPVNPTITAAAGGIKVLPYPTDRTGIWISTRLSSTDNALYRNGSTYATTSTSNGSRSYSSGLTTVRILTRNSSSETSPRRQGFHTIGAGSGKGLTSTQASNLYTLISDFNTTAGR